MIIYLDEMISYGEWYRSEYPIWWFDINRYKIMELEEVGSLQDELGMFETFPDYEGLRDIGIIPFFQTDMETIQKEYIKLMNNPKGTKHFNALEGTELDIALMIYIDLNDLGRDWHEFRRKKLMQDGEAWCRENRINYRIHKPKG